LKEKKGKMNSKELQNPLNKEFYNNCNSYFAHLRKEGKIDYDFEDEFYFTMPAISTKQ
jgi:hypothetical protein